MQKPSQTAIFFDAGIIQLTEQLNTLARATEAVQEVHEPAARATVATKAVPPTSTLDTTFKELLAAPVLPTFDAYVAARSVTDEPVTLEEIHALAADGSNLEQIFWSLAESASFLQSQTDDPLSKWRIITTTLVAIETELPVCLGAKGKRSILPHMTPPMTNKLVTLLSDLGYAYPQATLIKSVAEHGLTYLFDALHYVSRQFNRAHHHELLETAGQPRKLVRSPQHLGQALLNLYFMHRREGARRASRSMLDSAVSLQPEYAEAVT